MRHPCTAALVVMLAALAACGERDPATRATVRDSAGVAIVENATLPEPDTSGWSVSAEPTLTIGVVEGEAAYQFQYIRGVTRLSDGRIVVVDQGSSQIRYFDERGRHLASVGREGDGPGEFRFLQHAFRRPGDTLIVISGDDGAAYSLIPPAAESARPIAYVPAFRWPNGMLSDGRMVHVRYANSVPPTSVGFVQDSVLLVVEDFPSALAAPTVAAGGSGNAIAVQLRADEIPADTVVRLPGNAEFRQKMGNGVSNAGVVFGRRVEVAIDDVRMVVGIGTEGIVQIHAPDGRLVRSIRFTGAREPLEQDEIDAWKEWRLAMVRNPMQQRVVDAYIAALQFPVERPVSSQIVVDDEGWIWLERYAVDSGWPDPMTDAPRLWYVLDPDGRAVATVAVPPRLRIEEIGADYILGVSTDADGVETVRMYGLRRGGPETPS